MPWRACATTPVACSVSRGPAIGTARTGGWWPEAGGSRA
ncbi:hypothetical protein D779_0701 [Imhoffiella purpurea]|uniref:Uncharacterized protein n=1 Tax=Imhoffiella purpurea TaxID=1249627 RepID=W9V8N7_9GAMM|nr:hypothetical protein D779_0701 [Imhoffiella purpurea]